MTKLAPTTARGYGSAHQRRRTHWQTRLDAGEEIYCHRNCGERIDPTKWDLGHNDDRTDWTGPECIPCNRGAGARNATEARMVNLKGISRDW